MKAAHRTQLYLEELQYQYLRNLARSKHKSIAAIVRGIIDGLIYSGSKKGTDPIFKIVGLGRSGRKDVAARHDKYIYKKD